MALGGRRRVFLVGGGRFRGRCITLNAGITRRMARQRASTSRLYWLGGTSTHVRRGFMGRLRVGCGRTPEVSGPLSGSGCPTHSCGGTRLEGAGVLVRCTWNWVAISTPTRPIYVTTRTHFVGVGAFYISPTSMGFRWADGEPWTRCTALEIEVLDFGVRREMLTHSISALVRLSLITPPTAEARTIRARSAYPYHVTALGDPPSPDPRAVVVIPALVPPRAGQTPLAGSAALV